MRRLRGESAIVGGFAPVARRPAPGAVGVSAPRPTRAGVSALRVFALRGVAYAIAAYVVSVAVLVVGGAASKSAGEGWWILRTVLFALVAAVALLAARGADGVVIRGGELTRLGAAMLGGGLIWLALGELDMHVFGLFEFTDHSIHTLFHGAGEVAALVGIALACAPRMLPVLRRSGPA